MSGVGDKSTNAVIDEAARWVVRLSTTDVSLEDKREFVLWLKSSPVHLGEYLRAEVTWADLGKVDPPHRYSLGDLLASADVEIVELHATSRPSRVRSRAARSGASANRNEFGRIRSKRIGSDRARSGRIMSDGIRWRLLLRRGTALAACLALTFGAAAWVHLDFLADRYSTGVGEQRAVKLDDGSTIVLNTDTRLRLAFDSTLREVRLLEGEALFTVAKDRSRPFRVLSDQAVVQAVGTSFIVRRKSAQTLVTVIEGEVAVARSAQADAFSSTQVPEQAVRVRTGRRAEVADAAIRTTAVENLLAAAAWRSGRLIFEGATLAEAVMEFNRYNEMQLSLESSALSNERISGVFDADQPQALVHFLERSGVIEPTRISENEVILVPRR